MSLTKRNFHFRHPITRQSNRHSRPVYRSPDLGLFHLHSRYNGVILKLLVDYMTQYYLGPKYIIASAFEGQRFRRKILIFLLGDEYGVSGCLHCFSPHGFTFNRLDLPFIAIPKIITKSRATVGVFSTLVVVVHCQTEKSPLMCAEVKLIK